MTVKPRRIRADETPAERFERVMQKLTRRRERPLGENAEGGAGGEKRALAYGREYHSPELRKVINAVGVRSAQRTKRPDQTSDRT